MMTGKKTKGAKRPKWGKTQENKGKCKMSKGLFKTTLKKKISLKAGRWQWRERRSQLSQVS